MLTPVQSQRYAQLVNNFNEKEFYAYHDHLLEGGRVEDFFEKMEKHGTGDQKPHGSWATGSSGSATDLVASGTIAEINNELDSISREYNHEEQFTQGIKMEDKALDKIAKMQGFDALPQQARTMDEYSNLPNPIIENGVLAGQPLSPYVSNSLFRGFSSGKDSEGNVSSAQHALSEFEKGDYWSGKGSYGNGIYVAITKQTATRYAETKDDISEFKLAPDARVGSFYQIRADLSKEINSDNPPPKSVWNVGRYAAAKGYDAYIVEIESPDGGQIANFAQMVVFNRSKIILAPKKGG